MLFDGEELAEFKSTVIRENVWICCRREVLRIRDVHVG